MESNRAGSVERLVFYNHTECECRDRMEDLMPRDVSVPSVTSDSGKGSPANALSSSARHMFIHEQKNTNKNLQ